MPTLTANILAGGEYGPSRRYAERAAGHGRDVWFRGSAGDFQGGTNYKGSAVALSPEWVITAGHNVDLNDDGLPDVSWAGTFELPGYGSFNVTQAFTNPGFSGFANPSVNDDLALLHLGTPLPVGMGYPTLGSGAGIGDVITLVGFGRSGYGSYGYTTNATLTDRRYGSNAIDSFQLDDEGSGVFEIFSYDFDDPSTTGQLRRQPRQRSRDDHRPGRLRRRGPAAERRTAAGNSWASTPSPKATAGASATPAEVCWWHPYTDWISQVTGIPEPGILALMWMIPLGG